MIPARWEAQRGGRVARLAPLRGILSFSAGRGSSMQSQGSASQFLSGIHQPLQIDIVALRARCRPDAAAVIPAKAISRIAQLMRLDAGSTGSLGARSVSI